MWQCTVAYFPPTTSLGTWLITSMIACITALEALHRWSMLKVQSLCINPALWTPRCDDSIFIINDAMLIFDRTTAYLRTWRTPLSSIANHVPSADTESDPRCVRLVGSGLQVRDYRTATQCNPGALFVASLSTMRLKYPNLRWADFVHDKSTV